jgi:division protein CdvB (Snf7/Vps24/ESCRT-III family)
MAEKDTSIKEIDGADSLNALIQKINDVVDEWGTINDPIEKAKAAALKASGLDKTPGANITHVLLGLVLTMIADLNMSAADIKKQIKFLEKEPYIQIGAVDKYQALIDAIPPWLQSYFEGVTKVDDVAEKIQVLPGEAGEVTKNAPEEFSELEFMAKAKMIKNVAQTVSKIKDKCEEVMDQIKGLKTDLEDMKECAEKMKTELEGDALMELGKKCKTANKVSIKDCYECAYGVIKTTGGASKGGAGGAGGCCNTF